VLVILWLATVDTCQLLMLANRLGKKKLDQLRERERENLSAAACGYGLSVTFMNSETSEI